VPELPEVETTRRGIAPHIEGQTVQTVLLRDGRLRWPVLPDLPKILAGRRIQTVARRGKYLLLDTGDGTLLVHLGMSGSLRLVVSAAPVGKHDHMDIVFGHNTVLRFHDPRRFGAVLWVQGPVTEHPLLKHLGPEPLADGFDGKTLHALAKGRKMAVKSFIMDSRVVVGVGNIYANEALFRAGILPSRAVGKIALTRYQRLAASIREVLQQAIDRGGTTLRDFVNASGQPGYFQQQLSVYGRTGLPCVHCGQALTEIRLGNRSTVFCRACQR